jgi:DNA-binding XRE family transcriptional regulator
MVFLCFGDRQPGANRIMANLITRNKKARILRIQRNECGLTQLDVARITKINRARLSLIETMQVEPRPDEIQLIELCIAKVMKKRHDKFAAALGGADFGGKGGVGRESD